jgi:hypothetical protein
MRESTHYPSPIIIDDDPEPSPVKYDPYIPPTSRPVAQQQEQEYFCFLEEDPDIDPLTGSRIADLNGNEESDYDIVDNIEGNNVCS